MQRTPVTAILAPIQHYGYVEQGFLRQPEEQGSEAFPAKEANYLQYIGYVALGVLIPMILWLLAVQFQVGAITAQSHWPFDLYHYKTGIIEDLPSPKMFTVSGSSGLFNIRTSTIADRYGMAVANFSTDVELGLQYILSKAISNARPGDTILLALEYELYGESGRLNSVGLDYVFSRDPDYLRSLPIWTQVQYSLSLSLRRLITGIRSKFDPPPHTSKGYNAETINSFGDETNNLEENRNLERLANEHPTRFLIEGQSITPFAREQLTGFFDWAEANDVVVYASFPATLHFVGYDEPQALAAMQHVQAFYERHGIPVIGSPRDFLYDESLFYDTRYHLTDRGMTQNTELVAGLLDPNMHHLAPLEP